MAETLTIGVVPGVTPDKWVHAWHKRMTAVPLRVRAVAEHAAVAMLTDGVDMVFARLPVRDEASDRLSVIPLWTETPMVVAAKDHPIGVFDAVTLADLADEDVHPGWDEGTLDLVAAGHGVVRMPQSVFRATGRRDLVAREVSDADPTRIGLVWLTATSGPLSDEFIGIVRGRSANSSRGSSARGAPTEPTAKPTGERPGKASAKRPALRRAGRGGTRGRVR